MGKGIAPMKPLTPVAVVDDLGFQCIALDDSTDVIVIAEIAMPRVDRDTHGVGEFL